VVKRYGATAALDGVELSVTRGETLALVGETGSGKTTLLRTFNALVRLDRGRVEVDGEDVSRQDPVALRRRMGYVPQEGGLLPHWTILRNAALVPGLLGLPDRNGRAEAALERVGLDPGELGPRYPATLSGGQRQRVALARALAAGPKVILLDEPFGALDALTREELVTVFSRVLEPGDVTAVLVTHDLKVAVRLADRVGVMRGGRLIQVAAPGVLRDAPADPYVTALLRRGGVG
jgi:osmoprotectant transport system ATP-binding protein